MSRGPSKLDGDQAIKRAFDEATRALRVVGAPVVPTATDVVISSEAVTVICGSSEWHIIGRG